LLVLLASCALACSAYAAPPAASAKRHSAAAKDGVLNLKSTSVLVMDQEGKRVLYAKNDDAVVPIASITKLMTALVVLEAWMPPGELIAISKDDKDGLKGTGSRLQVGMKITRDDLLRLMLMASENRAAAALARAYPGGTSAFVAAMNQKAVELGMQKTRFVDGSGLSSKNVSTARDLARLVNATHRQPLIRQYTTDGNHTVILPRGRRMSFWNSNRLVKNHDWDIGLSKTGYITEAGRCLVMQARIASTPVIIVLLDSYGKMTRIGDANRIKKWIETNSSHQATG
jgi:D-alanyl-D-alanine endopeptidase (penicillin-binding protein 7)